MKASPGTSLKKQIPSSQSPEEIAAEKAAQAAKEKAAQETKED